MAKLKGLQEEGLTPIQLSKVKTLYMAGLDSQLKQQINNEYPNLLKAPTYVLEEPKED